PPPFRWHGRGEHGDARLRGPAISGLGWLFYFQRFACGTKENSCIGIAVPNHSAQTAARKRSKHCLPENG
ncbi:MAG: hypothetical protein ACK53V_12935, partial [Planctomycetota bacterium]